MEPRLDPLTPSERSERMARVRGKDTKPELQVRRLVHGMGFRYRLHRKDLPGKPDLVFPRFHKVIFVHGCFWHRHECKNGSRLPKSRLDFWETKLNENKLRDETSQQELQKMGWESLVVWECQLREPESTAERIREFLEDESEVS